MDGSCMEYECPVHSKRMAFGQRQTDDVSCIWCCLQTASDLVKLQKPYVFRHDAEGMTLNGHAGTSTVGSNKISNPRKAMLTVTFHLTPSTERSIMRAMATPSNIRRKGLSRWRSVFCFCCSRQRKTKDRRPMNAGINGQILSFSCSFFHFSFWSKQTP